MSDSNEMRYSDLLFDIENPRFREKIRDEVRRAVEFGEFPKPGSVLHGVIQLAPPLLVGIDVRRTSEDCEASS